MGPLMELIFVEKDGWNKFNKKTFIVILLHRRRVRVSHPAVPGSNPSFSSQQIAKRKNNLALGIVASWMGAILVSTPHKIMLIILSMTNKWQELFKIHCVPKDIKNGLNNPMRHTIGLRKAMYGHSGFSPGSSQFDIRHSLKIYFDVTEIYWQRWLEESGQRVDNVNWTHLVC